MQVVWGMFEVISMSCLGHVKHFEFREFFPFLFKFLMVFFLGGWGVEDSLAYLIKW